MTTSFSRSSPEAEIRRRLAEAEARRRGLIQATSLDRYRYDPAGYIQEQLGWQPWGGDEEHPGQLEVIQAYILALQQQHEKRDWENGLIDTDELVTWQPGQVIKNWIRVEAGHTVGKTKLSSGLVNHFFDCFPPAIVYSFAPSWKQIHDLLWKEIKADRRGKGLPGRILDLRLEVSDNHFATGIATSDAGGTGTTRVQGQHNEYLLFILDEAEGIPPFVWGAVDSMAGSGIAIVIMVANPQSRISEFHQRKNLSFVQSFRISCLHHPNVLSGREVIKGAVLRSYVERMIEKLCEVVEEHDDDASTFTVPFPVQIDGVTCPPGTIFKPGPEFFWRVLGIAPENIADDTFIPVGRYEAAKKRSERPGDPTWARFGVDVAGFGKDAGTLYIRHGMRAWRAAQMWQLDPVEYHQAIKKAALALPDCVWSLHIRIDAGGGYGSGAAALLKRDDELIKRFRDFAVVEVHFGGTPKQPSKYYDVSTELYAEAAETLKGLTIQKPPTELEADLCERIYKWRNVEGVSVRKLEDKVDFRKRKKRSPDDGDGFVLAIAPDHILPASRGEIHVVKKSESRGSRYRF